MPRLSLGLGAQNIRKVGGAASGGISLTAPTVYGSGLILQDQGDWTGGFFDNPYSLIFAGFWVGPADAGLIQYDLVNNKWDFCVAATYQGGDLYACLVATNTASPASLPTSGWEVTSVNLEVIGTLVLSTTP